MLLTRTSSEKKKILEKCSNLTCCRDLLLKIFIQLKDDYKIKQKLSEMHILKERKKEIKHVKKSNSMAIGLVSQDTFP